MKSPLPARLSAAGILLQTIFPEKLFLQQLVIYGPEKFFDPFSFPLSLLSKSLDIRFCSPRSVIAAIIST